MQTQTDTASVSTLDVVVLLRQLGRSCLALLGAKRFVLGQDKLQFAIGRGAPRGTTHVLVRLE